MLARAHAIRVDIGYTGASSVVADNCAKPAAGHVGVGVDTVLTSTLCVCRTAALVTSIVSLTFDFQLHPHVPSG